MPVIRLRHVIENILNQNLMEVKQKHHLINIFGLLINQNYFCINDALFRQKEGLVVGASSSSAVL
jgi:hypothetical protein